MSNERTRITVRKVYDILDDLHQDINQLGERFEGALNPEEPVVVEVEEPGNKFDWVDFVLGLVFGILFGYGVHKAILAWR